jgi:chromosome partitioning protein
MITWLKRKGPPPATEPSLESEGQTPLTDDRLERLLDRLGPGSDPAVALRSEPAVESRKMVEPPSNGAAKAPAPEVSRAPEAPPHREIGADPRSALRREDLTITTHGSGPSAAELLAKGYSFATGPDGKMVVFDTKGNLTNVALPRPVANRIEPVAAQEAETAPSVADSAAAATPVKAPPEIDPLTRIDGKRADKPATEALQETEPLPQIQRKPARKPAPAPTGETARAPQFERKAPEERGGGHSGMFVIAVSSQKGGSGKTTIAAHLAVAATAADHGPVVLIDTDPQGSLAEWWQARAADTPQLATVKPEALAANLAELRSYGTAIAIVDTPPALTGSIEQVIASADLIIIPARPSPHDLRAAAGTVEMARKAGKPFMFVVNGASPRASITAQAVAALSEHGRVAPVILYQRTEYAASMIDGRTVLEAAASGRSAQEIAELWQCVYAQIGLRVAA